MLKGVDKLVRQCFFTTGLEIRLKQVLEYDLSQIEQELNNVLARSLGVTSNNGQSPWKSLRDVYERDEDGCLVRNDEGWKKRNEDGELVILSNHLIRMSVTETGMYDGTHDSDVIEAWTEDFRVERVKWLNKKSEEQMALVHGTYGNNAGIATEYYSLVITLRIPTFQDR